MPFWLALGLFVVSTALTFIFRPRLPQQSQAGPQPLDFPTSEEGRPIPVVWGTVRLESPNSLWVGGEAVSRDTADPPNSTSGFFYYVNFQQGLCMGPIDSVGAMFTDGRLQLPSKEPVPLLLGDKVIAFGRVAAPWSTATLNDGQYDFQDLALEATAQMRTARLGEYWKAMYGFVVTPGWNDTLYMSINYLTFGTIIVPMQLQPGLHTKDGIEKELVRAFVEGNSVSGGPLGTTLTVDETAGKIRLTIHPDGLNPISVVKLLGSPDTGFGDMWANAMLGFYLYETKTAGTVGVYDSSTKVITADEATDEQKFTFASEFSDGVLAASHSSFTAEGHFGFASFDKDAKIAVGDSAKTMEVERYACGEVTSFRVSKGSAFGNEGGIAGRFNIYHGTDEQGQNAFLNGSVSTTISAYPGLCYLTYEPYSTSTPAATLYGFTNYAKPVTFVLRRTTSANLLGAATPDIGGDCNPAVIIYEILTDSRWGCKIPIPAIDTASFQVAADILAAEGLGVSTQLDSAREAGDLLGEILRHIDGVLFEDASSGLLGIKLARNDYDLAECPLIDDTNADDVKLSRPSWSETKNVVKVKFTDRDNDWTVGVAQAHDLANLTARSNEASIEEIPFAGLSNMTAALVVAERTLKVLSRPFASIEARVNRQLWRVRPGSVCRLTWPPLGITEMPIRVVRLNAGTIEDEMIQLEAVEDVYGASWNSYTTPT